MAYIWINPVVDCMYDEAALNVYLARHGFKRLHTECDWIAVVKEKYRIAVERSSHTVIDMRCPKIRPLLDEMEIIPKVAIPNIHPILIHSGIECSGRYEIQGENKIITTPCQALADMGNALELEDTWFVPWNRFIEFVGSAPECTIPEESPIPTGFFDELGLKTDSITGEEEIREYFENFEPNRAQLVEMLFCKEGCHNGDGVRMYSA